MSCHRPYSLSSQRHGRRRRNGAAPRSLPDPRACTPTLLLGLLATALALAACSAEPQHRGLPVATLLAQPTSVGGASHAHKPGPTSQPDVPTKERLPLAVDLVISEVMADPLLIADAVGEYVEVIYLGAEPASLRGVEVVLPDGRPVPLVPEAAASRLGERTGRARGRRARSRQPRLEGVQADGVVRPGQVVLLRSSRGMRLRLPNRAGRLELRRDGVVLDVAQWAGRWPWPKHRAGRALCRVRPSSDGSGARAWRRCRAPLRRVERGDPGFVGSTCAWLRARNVRTAACALAGRKTRRAKNRAG